MRQKKGVVLLITVGFITVIMGLIAYQFTIIDRGLKRSTQEVFYYQSTLLLADINEKLLPSMLGQLKQGEDAESDESTNEMIGEMLSGYYNIPFPLINDEATGTAVVTLRPSGTHFNINDFKNLDPNNGERDFFQYFTKELYDRLLLTDMIDLALENNVTRDPQEYSYLEMDEELPLNSPFFRHGEIVDKEQFRVILDAYYARTKDKQVYKLDWDSFLDFTSQGPKNISYLAYEYCRSLFYDQPMEWHDNICKNEDELVFYEEDFPNMYSDYNNTVNKHQITFDAFSPTLLIDIDYMVEEKHASFTLLYDIVKSKTRWIKARL